MSDKKQPTNIYNQNVTSHNQSGGVTAHTVNIDRRITRAMSNDFQASLLRDLLNDRPVNVLGLNGNAESMAFAMEIHGFLKANGYQMMAEAASSHMFFDPPVFNVKISPGNNGAEWWIVVGPAE